MENFNIAFKRIVEHQYTSVVILNSQYRLEYINSSGELLLVRSQKQLIGINFFNLFLNSEEIQAIFDTSLDEGASVSVKSATWELFHRDSVQLDFTVSPFLDNDKIFLMLEMQPVDRSLYIRKAAGSIDQTETSRHLVRSLAHEIKNPLGGIRGAAQLLEGELPSFELKEYTRVIIEEADRLRNLVDRLLGSHQLPDFSNVNIHQILERVISLIKAEAGDRIELNRDYDPSIPVMKGDESQLIQVFLNIARNALQALEDLDKDDSKIVFRSRIVRQFTVRRIRYRIVARVDIIDNGPGIDNAIRDKIFHPMISGRPAGSGLGLSIVQQFVELHRGVVVCESDEGHTQFSVYLPLECTNA